MKNISLIGMMGSGKTTIGKNLSRIFLDFKFIDTDEAIVQKQKMSINDIFVQKGEDYFRNLETSVLKEVLSSNNQIISTGGGIILKEENRDLLKQNSIVIYLQATSDILFERVKNNKDRPLLKVDDMKSKIECLLEKREALYRDCSHFIIDTNNKNIDEIISEIEGIVKSNG